jgi:molybdopterin molybdotransferase
MISVREAIQTILEFAAPLPARRIPVDLSLGLELAEDVVSPRDVPSFRKALMDGVAVRCADFDSHGDCFTVGRSITAGSKPMGQIATGEAWRIMTGAPVPVGADTVIPREQLIDVTPDWRNAHAVRLASRPQPLQNMLQVGEIARSGEVVLASGTRITAATRAFLMELGLPAILSRPAAAAAILSSGNELVDWPTQPPPGCICNTNGPMLSALLHEFGCVVEQLGIVADNRAELLGKIQQGLAADILVITGGVSVGDLDLVPHVLQQANVRQRFHGVAMKPGKPIWFGTHQGKLVFGLPGNPLSAFVGFHVLIRPAIARLMGQNGACGWIDLPLASSHVVRGDRETFLPARQLAGQDPTVEILPWKGSSDLRTLAIATGLVRFAPTGSEIPAGEMVPYLALDGNRHGDTHSQQS